MREIWHPGWWAVGRQCSRQGGHSPASSPLCCPSFILQEERLPPLQSCCVWGGQPAPPAETWCPGPCAPGTMVMPCIIQRVFKIRLPAPGAGWQGWLPAAVPVPGTLGTRVLHGHGGTGSPVLPCCIQLRALPVLRGFACSPPAPRRVPREGTQQGPRPCATRSLSQPCSRGHWDGFCFSLGL